MKRSYVWPDRSDGAERTGRGTDVNTARLCFGNGEQTAFHQLNESPKCSCELQANMAEYCVCGSPVGGRFVSMEMSWGVPVYAAWSPRTPRGRPLPEDWESSRLRFEKKDKVQQREGRGREEGRRGAGWSSVGATFIERLHPWITGAGCQFLLPPPHDLLQLGACTLLETQTKQRHEQTLIRTQTHIWSRETLERRLVRRAHLDSLPDSLQFSFPPIITH